nr:hypothetical protein [Angustibacter aerolatus]
MLTDYYGDLTISTPGTVVDGLDVHGFVKINAANVTIKRSKIRGGVAVYTAGNRSLISSTQPGAVIEDVEPVARLPLGAHRRPEGLRLHRPPGQHPRHGRHRAGLRRQQHHHHQAGCTTTGTTWSTRTTTTRPATTTACRCRAAGTSGSPATASRTPTTPA